MFRVVFFGTEKFAVQILNSLAENSAYEIVGVITQPARPVGRKQILTPSPVAIRAAELQIPTLTPEKLKNEAVISDLQNFNADVFVVAQYGLIIPQAILDLPPRGVVNVHASLLPRHRGASPVHAAILAGDAVTGTSFMVMDAAMDHGAVFARYEHSIKPTDTTETLMHDLGVLSAEHFPHDLKAYLEGTLVAVPQNHDEATFTGLLTRASGYVDWSTKDASAIERMVRALYPWPGVTIFTDATSYKLVSVHVENPSKTGFPGTFIVQNNKLYIETLRGDICIDELQPAGKDTMTAEQFLRGNSSISGEVCVTPDASLK